MKCYSGASKSSNDNPIDLKTLDEDKMRCQILDCLIALCRVQKQKDIEGISHRLESTKRRIFAAAVALIIDEKLPIESDQHVVSFLMDSFPDSIKMTDDRKWLPLHFAVALGNKVSEEDVHMLYSSEPLAMRRYDFIEPYYYREEAHTPGHFLCMQTYPNIALIRYLSLRDIKAFMMPTITFRGVRKNCLQLASKYSVSVELLKTLLQVDRSMINRFVFHGAFRVFYEVIFFKSSSLLSILFFVSMIIITPTYIFMKQCHYFTRSSMSKIEMHVPLISRNDGVFNNC
jgi:hypothetical protein